MHRDLKLENILLDKYQQVKITDFGWAAAVIDNELRSTFCGTVVYLAPEMISGDGK